MGRTHIGIAGSTAMIAVMMAAASVTAGAIDTWSGVTLRHTAGVALQDADFSGQNVVVVWQEPGQELWLRRSDIWGDAFSSRRQIASSARQAETDICGGDAYISYARNISGQWRIRAAHTDASSGGLDTMPVSFGSGRASDPDVACAGGRLFVTWLQRMAGQDHVMVDHTLRDGGTFSGATAMDLGTQGFARGPVVAGVSDRAYLAFQSGNSKEGGPLAFHRWSVGGSPVYPAVYLGGTEIAANGTDPVIAAAGTKVVVVWSAFGAGNSLRARVSNDRGMTWGPVRHLQPGGGGGIEDAFYIPRSAAIRGSRIVIAFALAGCSPFPGGGCSSTEYMMSTTNDFATRERTRLTDDPGDPIGDPVVLGILVSPNGQQLAAAIDRGSRILFRRDDS